MRGAVASRRNCGFTLVELLVVMGLVAVLLTLVTPVAQRGIEAARTTRCAANLRSLGTEVLGVISENGGALPWYEAAKGRSGMWWYRVLERSNFEGFSAKMTCPSAKDPYVYTFSPQKAKLTGTYNYNKYMGYRNKLGEWTYAQVRVQNITEPSRLALLADSRLKSDDSAGFETWEPLYKSHQEKTTAVVFCLDGHIEIFAKDNPRKIVFPPYYLNKP